MKDIVSIHHDEPRAGTLLIAQGFRRKHQYVRKLINKHRSRFETYGPIYSRKVSRKEEANYRISNPVIDTFGCLEGQKAPRKNVSANYRISKGVIQNNKAGRHFEEFLLNEDQALFLVTLFRNSEIVLDFKQRLVHEFSSVRKQLTNLQSHKATHEYQLTRSKGKLIRRESTDTIKQFVEYAYLQGSTHSDNYYQCITRMVNASLFVKHGRFNNLREALSVRQLMTLATVEQIVDRALSDGMESGLHYKDVFQLAKSKVIQFVSLFGKTDVVDYAIDEHLSPGRTKGVAVGTTTTLSGDGRFLQSDFSIPNRMTGMEAK